MKFTRTRHQHRATFAVALGGASSVAFMLTAVALPANAGAASTPIKTGYYAANVKIPSADIEFHVRAGNVVPDLALVCFPKDPALVADSGEAQLAIHMPKETIKGNSIVFSGTVKVTAAANTKTVAEDKLSINIHHVTGPVYNYTFEGVKHSETRAWEGTVSSPACRRIPAGGQVKLYGPVPGE
jgi:hypothetical protein